MPDEIEIIRVAPGVGYSTGSFGKSQTKNGGKIAGRIAHEKAQQRRNANSKNAKVGAMKKRIYGTKGLRSTIG